MLKNKIYCLLEWLRTRKRTIYFVIILLSLCRFFYLNYINWTSGELCTGKGGIQYGYDAFRYLDGAERIINGQKFIEKESNYIGYILVIALVKKSGFDLSFVLIIQLLLALLAALALFDMTRSITGSKMMGLLAAGFYLINPFITQWHLFIHTESFYSSMLAISTWSIYKAVNKNNFKFYITSLIIICYTALVRPNGWCLIPIFFCAAILIHKINFKIKLISIASVFTIFVLIIIFVFSLNNKLKNENAANLLMKGEIIWGHKESRLNMPANNDSVSEYKYILKHPVAVAKLGITRIATELLPIHRPWNSLNFIFRFLLWMLPAYLLSLIGMVFLRKNIGVIIIMTVIILHFCIIAFTFSDQEFRFLIYVLPLIYLMGIFGLNEILKSFIKYNNK